MFLDFQAFFLLLMNVLNKTHNDLVIISALADSHGSLGNPAVAAVFFCFPELA